jgi:uncharacterized membrane protein
MEPGENPNSAEVKKGQGGSDSPSTSPQAKTSPNIGLSLSVTELETAPGGSVQTILSVHNSSNIVDRFHIKVEGLDPTWWTLSVPNLALFPGDRSESKLTIRVPKEAEAMAGSYSFRVKATSEADLREETVVAALLLVHGFVSWEVEMSPTRVEARKGTYRINAHNSGNADAVLLFEGKDPEEALTFGFGRNKVTVPAGGDSQVQLTIYPKQGDRQKAYYFQVTSKLASSSREVKILSGQLDYIPPKRPWWIMPAVVGGVGTVLILLGIGAGIYQATTTESHLFGLYSTSSSSTPYRVFTIPLLIIGTLLVIAGILIWRRKRG